MKRTIRKITKSIGIAVVLGCVVIAVCSVDPYAMGDIGTAEFIKRWFWCGAFGYGAYELFFKRKKPLGWRSRRGR